MFDYIVRFYNQQRKHSKQNFFSPAQFEPGSMGQKTRPRNRGKPDSSLLGPQAAPALGADLASDQLAGIRLGDEIQAAAALLLALRLSLVLHAFW